MTTHHALTHLQQQKDSCSQLLQKMRTIGQSLHYEGLERINSTALFHVRAKHTHEFTIDIGAGYFAELSAQQAALFFERRIQRIEAEIEKYSAAEQPARGKQQAKAGPEASIRTGESGKRAYLEVVGEENGEEIVNIVEIQGESEELGQKAEQQATQHKQGPTDLESSQQNQVIQFPKNSLFGSEEKQEDQDNGFQSSEKSEKSDISEDSENEYGDLIHYHRKKVTGIDSGQVQSTPFLPISATNITTPKSENAVSMQEISKTDTKKTDSAKKKKRVSFADEQSGGKLAQLLRQEEEKEDLAKQQLKQKEQQQQKEQQKQKEKEKGKGKRRPQKEDEVDRFQSGKISRFKLQRMKARMQGK